jgi:hypothetical protein
MAVYRDSGRDNELRHKLQLPSIPLVELTIVAARGCTILPLQVFALILQLSGYANQTRYVVVVNGIKRSSNRLNHRVLEAVMKAAMIRRNRRAGSPNIAVVAG